MTSSRPIIDIDFETKSAANLKAVGSWKYSLHPTTEVLCLSWELNGLMNHWHPAVPSAGIEEEGAEALKQLFWCIRSGYIIRAHNVFFERAIWLNVCVRRYGWPSLVEENLRCTAALAACNGLPRDLETLLDEALHAPHGFLKDKRGKYLINRLSKPRKLNKAEREEMGWGPKQKVCEDCDGTGEFYAHGVAEACHCIRWNDTDPEPFRQMYEYNKQDVRGESWAGKVMPEMSERELRIWQMDQRMNLRGVRGDRQMAIGALWLAEAAVDEMNAELSELTGGWLKKASQRALVKDYINCTWPSKIFLNDTRKETIEPLVKKFKDSDPKLHRVLQILLSANKTSTKKYSALLDRADPDDDCLRDMCRYHGGHTGRWAGQGLQPHNMVRGKIKDIGQAAWVIAQADYGFAKAMFGDVMTFLADSMRGMFFAREGKVLYVADYAAIEARVVFWLASCQNALNIFLSGGDIYCDMASRVYRRTITKDDANERQMGKQAILGLGFGMGFCKFLTTLRKYNIKFTAAEVRTIVGREYDELLEFISKDKICQISIKDSGFGVKDYHELVLTKFIVDIYREQYPEVKQNMWKAQEDAAIKAVLSRDEDAQMRDVPVEEARGKAYKAGPIKWRCDGRMLLCRLPSGRCLHYWDPELIGKKPKWADKARLVLHYNQVDQKTGKWTQDHTYGGKLTENIVQSVARDIMADGLLRIEESETYEPLLSVHDEGIAEADEGKGSVEEYASLMALTKDTPAWLVYNGVPCPVDAEAWSGPRYRK